MEAAGLRPFVWGKQNLGADRGTRPPKTNSSRCASMRTQGKSFYVTKNFEVERPANFHLLSTRPLADTWIEEKKDVFTNHLRIRPARLASNTQKGKSGWEPAQDIGVQSIIAAQVIADPLSRLLLIELRRQRLRPVHHRCSDKKDGEKQLEENASIDFKKSGPGTARPKMEGELREVALPRRTSREHQRARPLSISQGAKPPTYGYGHAEREGILRVEEAYEGHFGGTRPSSNG